MVFPVSYKEESVLKEQKKYRNQKSYTLPVLGGVFAVALLVMAAALFFREASKDTFTPPPFESAAVAGVPEVSEELGYTQLYKEGMVYRVSICGIVTMEEQDAIVYFTNTEGNEKYLKLRVLDEQEQVLGETGLLKPGEYVKAVALNKELKPGTPIKLKVMGYQPETYESAGCVTLSVTTQ